MWIVLPFQNYSECSGLNTALSDNICHTLWCIIRKKGFIIMCVLYWVTSCSGFCCVITWICSLNIFCPHAKAWKGPMYISFHPLINYNLFIWLPALQQILFIETSHFWKDSTSNGLGNTKWEPAELWRPWPSQLKSLFNIFICLWEQIL